MLDDKFCPTLTSHHETDECEWGGIMSSNSFRLWDHESPSHVFWKWSPFSKDYFLAYYNFMRNSSHKDWCLEGAVTLLETFKNLLSTSQLENIEKMSRKFVKVPYVYFHHLLFRNAGGGLVPKKLTFLHVLE